LPIHALGPETIDVGILLDEPQILLRDFAERLFGRPVGIEQLVEE
jgi:hypothetical protein